MWGNKFRHQTQRVEKVPIEDIVKATLEKFAISYKMGQKKSDFEETDKYASDFIKNTMPQDYERMLSYYDFLKQNGEDKNAWCKRFVRIGFYKCGFY